MTKAKLAIAAAAALVLFAPVAAIGGTGMDLYNECGNGLKAGVLHRGDCHGFIVGVASGLIQARQICFRGTLGGEQATMIVQAYMREHPEELGAQAGEVVTHALRQAYPCP